MDRHLSTALILCVLLAGWASGQTKGYTIKRLGVEAGLPDNNIHAIVEGKDGVLWFGTGNGLCQYENGKITVYRPNETAAPSMNDVRAIFEDAKGIIWAGTFGGGLAKFNRGSGTFTVYKHKQGKRGSLSDDRVLSLLENKKGVLRIGTVNGLNILDRAKNIFTHLRHIPSNANSLPSDRISSMLEDSKGELWIGTLGGGLSKFNSKSGVFTHYQYDFLNRSTVASNTVTALHESKAGKIWVGAARGGLDRLMESKKHFVHYLDGESIYGIAETADGKIIVGSYGQGVKILDPFAGSVETFIQNVADPTSLGSDFVLSVCVDRRGNIWAGTEGGGISMLTPRDTNSPERELK